MIYGVDLIVPSASTLVKKWDYGSKVSELNNRIPDLSSFKNESELESVWKIFIPFQSNPYSM